MTLTQLFSKPGTWTQGPYALDRLGNAISPTHRSACKWCLVGGLLKITNGVTQHKYFRVLNALKCATDNDPVHWNERPGV
jgi:hypothetical protein